MSVEMLKKKQVKMEKRRLEEIEIVNRMSLLKCKEEVSQVSVTPECTRPAQTRLGRY